VPKKRKRTKKLPKLKNIVRINSLSAIFFNFVGFNSDKK